MNQIFAVPMHSHLYECDQAGILRSAAIRSQPANRKSRQPRRSNRGHVRVACHGTEDKLIRWSSKTKSVFEVYHESSFTRKMAARLAVGTDSNEETI